ncbi:MAG: class I SAM-dependent methyltransferase [Planctomycetota bacterium]
MSSSAPFAHRLLSPVGSSSDATPLGWSAKLARKIVVSALSQITDGQLAILDRTDGSTFRFGSSRGDRTLTANLEVLHPSFWTALLSRGSLGSGESWTEGAWTCDDLTRLVRLMLRNRSALEGLDGGFAKLASPFLRFLHWRNANTRDGSRRNIAAHYDLGNEFFAAFLDPTMCYSSGIFESDAATMEQASVAKIDRLCRRLELTADDHLLEIGTGWGALAMHAARNYGCRVTSTTISREQFEGARQRVAAAGLRDRVEILCSDYRDLSGTYDKLVHCEMVEAVGAKFLDGFLGKCAALLRDGGRMAMQAITIADSHYRRALSEVDFIKRYIFPGSFIPSATALIGSATVSAGFRLLQQEDFGQHYARTLAHWRDRMYQNLDEIRAMGKSDAFLRQWEFYLCYCEGGFAEGWLGLSQMLFERPALGRSPRSAGGVRG